MTPEITAAAGRIMDVFMGGYTGWRDRIDESGILASADWAQAVRLASAALNTAPSSDGEGEKVCTGCGSTKTLEQIRADHPQAISCCPERDMQPPAADLAGK